MADEQRQITTHSDICRTRESESLNHADVPPGTGLPDTVLTGRWTDDDPPATPAPGFPTMSGNPTGQGEPAESDVAALVADATPTVLGRTVLAVAAMHEPNECGRCPWCHPAARWWRRRPSGPCRTRRVIVAELRTGVGPHWVSA